jgi:acetylornithine deacetylase/succinyl-diaminopimelate desuccinylase-like protein
MPVNAQTILERAKAYRDVTAENLSRIVRVPALSCGEKERIALLQELCREAGFEEVKVDGLGNLLARVGSGPKILAIDAHIDTVDTGDRGQWRASCAAAALRISLAAPRA